MTNKIYDTLKSEYKKSNTLRRITILKKFGFETEQEYLNFLTYQLKKRELLESIKETTKAK